MFAIQLAVADIAAKINGVPFDGIAYVIGVDGCIFEGFSKCGNAQNTSAIGKNFSLVAEFRSGVDDFHICGKIFRQGNRFPFGVCLGVTFGGGNDNDGGTPVSA